MNSVTNWDIIDIPSAFDSTNTSRKSLKKHPIDFHFKTWVKRRNIILKTISDEIIIASNNGRYSTGYVFSLSDFPKGFKIMPTRNEIKKVLTIFKNKGYNATSRDHGKLATTTVSFKITWNCHIVPLK